MLGIDELNFVCSVENGLKLAQSWYGPLCLKSFVKPIVATVEAGTTSGLLQCGADVEIL